MVRKVSGLLLVLVLIVAFSSTAQAYTIYDGSPSNTYITYFRDILSGEDFNSNYVAFRSGQNEYIMLVGELELNGDNVSLKGNGKEYKFYTLDSGSYNSNYRYSVKEVSSGSVNVGDYIVYSDLGGFPELIERGDKYEGLTVLLITTGLLCIVINRIFFKR